MQLPPRTTQYLCQRSFAPSQTEEEVLFTSMGSVLGSHCLQSVSLLLSPLYPLQPVHLAHLHVCHLYFSKISYHLHLYKCIPLTIVPVPDRRCKDPSDTQMTRNGPQIKRIRHPKNAPKGYTSALEADTLSPSNDQKTCHLIHTGVCFPESSPADRW